MSYHDVVIENMELAMKDSYWSDNPYLFEAWDSVKASIVSLLRERDAALTAYERALRERDELTADRDSWMQQASDRTDDAVKFARERDAACELENRALQNMYDVMRERDEARALLREWIDADSVADGNGYGIGDDDLTKRTEDSLAGGRRDE